MPAADEPDSTRAPMRESNPLALIQARDSPGFLLSGRMTASGVPSLPGSSVKRTDTPSARARGSKSSKFKIPGSFITAISISPFAGGPSSPRSAESSRATARLSSQGITPRVGRPSVRPESMWRPGSSSLRSPLNLFIRKPFTRARSSSVSRARVPAMAAKTPPLSISPTSSTGQPKVRATFMFTISLSLRLISAGLPAPSTIIRSFAAESFSKDSSTELQSTSRQP